MQLVELFPKANTTYVAGIITDDDGKSHPYAIPEWNRYSREKRAEIISRLIMFSTPDNIIAFPRSIDLNSFF